MRSADDVQRVFELWEVGFSKKAIARQTGVSRTRVRVWLSAGLEATLNSPMRLSSVGAAGPCDRHCGLNETVD
jgi:hypothetical protein